MTNDNFEPILEIEKEDVGEGGITKPYDPNKIKISTHNKNLGFIIEMLQYDEIDLMPDFQREGDLWTRKQKSQLIESILLGLTLPSFYFSEYEEERTQKWAVVDGLQRLSTFKEFIVSKDSFKLEGLEFLGSYKGKTYHDLSREDKRKISGFTLNFYVIEKETPKDVKFLIFQRVNSGGLELTSQEMRHALNQGIPANFVKKLAQEVEEFKTVTDNKIPSKRQEDREFVNRFIAFYLLGYQDNYEGELESFLNNAMSLLDKKTKDELHEIESAFKKSMQLAYDIFGKDAFRKINPEGRRSPISKALFDTLSVNFAWLDDSQQENLKHKGELFKNQLYEMFSKIDSTFYKSITTSTGHKSNVQTRFETVKNLIKNVLEC